MISSTFIVLLFAVFSPVALSYSCDRSNPGGRKEGGWAGISQGECEGRGMCWDSGTPNAKWCYRGDDKCDNSNPGGRIEGGWAGISAKECLDRGMCWDPAPGAKWCFKGKDNCDNSDPTQREEGGWAGISGKECLTRGMCWDNTIPNVKYCFKPRHQEQPHEEGSTLISGNLSRPPAVFTTYNGFDIKGPNIATPALPSIQACSDKCGRNRNCIAFVYYSDSQQCALKSAVESFEDTGDEDIITGLSQYVKVVQD